MQILIQQVSGRARVLTVLPSFLIIIAPVLQTEHRGSHLWGKYPTTELHPQFFLRH